MILRRSSRVGLLLLAAACVFGQERADTARPAIRFLAPSPRDLPFGATRIEVEVSEALAGDAMDFFVDGRKVESVAKPPWQAVWQAGDTPRSHVITVALLRGGREIASARLETRAVGFASSASAHAVSIAPIVTDAGGHAVRGLSQKDFTVFDDGQPQKIETFDAADSPMAAILVLDISGSMMPKLDDARRAAHAFLDALKPEDQVGLFTFNTSIVGSVDLTRDRATLHAAIDQTHPEGETALFDATASALRRLKNLKKRKAVVLFTDGEDNRSRLSVNQVVEMARASEVSIFSVAQGASESKVLMLFLNRLAEETGGQSYFIGNIRKLDEVFRSILADLKSQYFLTYTPANLKPRSWHRIQVRVDRPDVVVRAKKEYLVE